MKILIAYATRSGTTAECARMLAAQLSVQQVELCDIEHESCPAPGDYDFVVLGAPIRYGKLHPAMRSFMRGHEAVLAGVRLGVFICCGYTDSAPEYLNKLIPPTVAERATIMASFGGRVVPAEQHGMDRLMARMIIGAITDSGEEEGLVKVAHMPEIDPDSISRFADAIKQSFGKR